MEKLYTEKQYQEYSNLMEKMVKEDNILEGFNIHLEIENWIKESKLPQSVIDQMDDRLEEEFNEEIKNQN